jgi:hypothetical protein
VLLVFKIFENCTSLFQEKKCIFMNTYIYVEYFQKILVKDVLIGLKKQICGLHIGIENSQKFVFLYSLKYNIFFSEISTVPLEC